MSSISKPTAANPASYYRPMGVRLLETCNGERTTSHQYLQLSFSLVTCNYGGEAHIGHERLLIEKIWYLLDKLRCSLHKFIGHTLLTVPCPMTAPSTLTKFHLASRLASMCMSYFTGRVTSCFLPPSIAWYSAASTSAQRPITCISVAMSASSKPIVQTGCQFCTYLQRE